MKVARAGAIYALANFASAGVPFLLLPLLTRALSPAEYGVVVNFFLLVSLCSACAGLSVHGALGVAWFNRQPTEMPGFVGSALFVAATSTALVAAFAALVLGIFFDAGSGLTPIHGVMAAVMAGAQIVFQCRLVLWQSQQQPAKVAALQVAGSVLNVCLSLLAVIVLQLGGEGRNLGAAGAAVIMAAIAVALLRNAGEARMTVKREHLRSLVAFGGPLIPHALAGVMLSSADRFIVSALLGTDVLGVYGAGAQLGAVMAILADAFVKAFTPWVYARMATRTPEDSLRLSGAMYLAIPAFLGLGAVIAIAMWWVAPLILGPAYAKGLSIIPWFMLGGAFSGMYLAVSGLYFFANKTNRLSVASVSAVTLGVACSVALTLRFSVAGAAAGYALTQLLLAMFAWILAVRTFPLPWGQPLKAVRAWWGTTRSAASTGGIA